MNIKHVFNVVVPLSRKTECIEHFSDSINRIISMVLLHNLLKKPQSSNLIYLRICGS
jgi:two-component sensor histidine kinase